MHFVTTRRMGGHNVYDLRDDALYAPFLTSSVYVVFVVVLGTVCLQPLRQIVRPLALNLGVLGVKARNAEAMLGPIKSAFPVAARVQGSLFASRANQ
jgi:hypothetical protein